MVLAKIEAPPLSCGKGPEESYRLTWIHAFSSTRPVVVTLERSGRTWSAVGVELTGFVEKTVARRTSRRLSNEEAATLARTIESTAFWNTRVALDPEGAIDGDTWVIEGRHGKAYHVVRRSGNEHGGPQTLGMMFVRLAGLQPQRFMPGGPE